ncbi:MAG: TonB-dependent receptor plug domain-containing protein [Chitinophagales bacterium]
MGWRRLVFTFTAIILNGASVVRGQSDSLQMQDVVVTGSLKAMRKDEFAIPVEIFTQDYFRQNNVNTLHEAVQMISGIQPNIDGAVDGASDIEINGMEGHYTLILIDGNPISGGNSSFYGLSGIPVSIIERIEVIKGPASTLYGSDAMSGVINVITKNPERTPRFTVEEKLNTYLENNAELSFRVNEKKAAGLFSATAFNANNAWDKNRDGFMDVPKVNRIALFNKWSFRNKYQKPSAIYGRYIYENRLGGEVDFASRFAGGDFIYGEWIRTSRFEIFGNFQLPVKRDNVLIQLAYTDHRQKANYGLIPFNNQECNARVQISWDNKFSDKSDLLVGAVYKFKYYDDNLSGTTDAQGNNAPWINHQPALFIQDMIIFNNQHQILAGLRYEFNAQNKGNAIIPRFDYKWNSVNRNYFVRFSLGSGFRTPNFFMDDRYAFISGKKIIVPTDIKTELTYGSSLSFEARLKSQGHKFNIEVRPFFTAILNAVETDFESVPDAILYSNEDGLGLNYGFLVSGEAQFAFPLKLYASATFLQYKLRQQENGETEWENALNSPVLNATYTVSYTFRKAGVSLDWNGVINSPMRLVTVPNDFRSNYSPWFCMMNLQLTKRFKFGLELFAGLNNLLNVRQQSPILRANDPFNNYLNDLNSNPLHYSFNASYIYAANQGIRGFFGLRYVLRD